MEEGSQRKSGRKTRRPARFYSPPPPRYSPGRSFSSSGSDEDEQSEDDRSGGDEVAVPAATEPEERDDVGEGNRGEVVVEEDMEGVVVNEPEADEQSNSDGQSDSHEQSDSDEQNDSELEAEGPGDDGEGYNLERDDEELEESY